MGLGAGGEPRLRVAIPPSRPGQFQLPSARVARRIGHIGRNPTILTWPIPTFSSNWKTCKANLSRNSTVLTWSIQPASSSRLAWPSGQLQRFLAGSTSAAAPACRNPIVRTWSVPTLCDLLQGSEGFYVAIPPSRPGQFQYLRNPLLGLLDNEVAIPPSWPGTALPRVPPLAGFEELWIGMVPRARALGYKSAALRARRDAAL